MAKKDQKVEEAHGKAADAILDILAELPADKARQTRTEIKALAFKSCIRVPGAALLRFLQGCGF